jgi:serine/threonine-protein phosphatase 5
MEHLRASSKGGADPPVRVTPANLASDVLWSDPVARVGHRVNSERGYVGTVFGSDVTAQFCEAEGIELILRSHEGPDAREPPPRGRSTMQPMSIGFTLDHDTPAGVLLQCCMRTAEHYHMPLQACRHCQVCCLVLHVHKVLACSNACLW